MNAEHSRRHRFPALSGPSGAWARFDGPSGTQLLDTALAAMVDWVRSGNTAAVGGPFEAAQRCAELLDHTRSLLGRLFGADPLGFSFGPNTTTNNMALANAISETLGPGDTVVSTRLDHDSNVMPWRRACSRAGARQVMADFDRSTGELQAESVVDLIDDSTRWVTVPMASNLLGTMPDLAPIIEAAHRVGARVFVDAVAAAPHHRIDITALDCDVMVTSPYKWYGPHLGVIWCRPEIMEELDIWRVRPAGDRGPRKFETGMPNFEGIVGTAAAASFLLEEDIDAIARYESEIFGRLWEGLGQIPGVRRIGPTASTLRAPTAAFTIDGVHPSAASTRLAAEQIAVWDGHAYAVEVVEHLGLADRGGVIRAGVVRYIETEDVDRLLQGVARLSDETRR
ncbi:MAG: aminotransferase class V-fold PLP-dependent enzyme [Ilumatobacteraceae bacterium]